MRLIIKCINVNIYNFKKYIFSSIKAKNLLYEKKKWYFKHCREVDMEFLRIFFNVQLVSCEEVDKFILLFFFGDWFFGG